MKMLSASVQDLLILKDRRWVLLSRSVLFHSLPAGRQILDNLSKRSGRGLREL